MWMFYACIWDLKMAGTWFKASLGVRWRLTKHLKRYTCVCGTYLWQSAEIRLGPVLRCSARCTHTGLHPPLMHVQSPTMLWQISWYGDTLGLWQRQQDPILRHTQLESLTHAWGVALTASQLRYVNVIRSRAEPRKNGRFVNFSRWHNQICNVQKTDCVYHSPDRWANKAWAVLMLYSHAHCSACWVT